VSEHLRIDRIELRLRGGSAHRAREIASQLGRALQPTLERELSVRGRAAGAQRVARVEAATVSVAGGAPAHETAAAVARAVADGLPGGTSRGQR